MYLPSDLVDWSDLQVSGCRSRAAGGEVGDDVGAQGEVGGECKYEEEVNACYRESARDRWS